MSTEQQHPSEWTKTAYQAQTELAEQGIDVEVKTVDEVLVGRQAKGRIRIEDLGIDDDDEPDAMTQLAEWVEALSELADALPTQDNHYGWLVLDKVQDRLRDVTIELHMYLKEQEQIALNSCMLEQ